MKFIQFNELAAWRQREGWMKPRWSGAGGPSQPGWKDLVCTNGCFDFLHAGHVHYLKEAAKLGFLLVGVNDDAGVTALKGPGRPVQTAEWRAEVLAELECVGAVTIFPGTSAVGFLEASRPAVWVKGGDYASGPDRRELEAVEASGGLFKVVPIARLVHSSGR